MLVKTGDPLKSREIMYKVFIQAVILYGREIWMVTDVMMAVL